VNPGDFALLSDCQGAALVARDGSIDWWCSPRFDSPSAFSRLLDPGAGHFSIRPAAPHESEWRYLEGSMVLETVHRSAGGAVRVTDALALEPGARGHEIGVDSPHVLVRQVECVEGECELDIEFVPRPEYGVVSPLVVAGERGVATVGGCERLLLDTAVSLVPERGHATGRHRMRAGERASFVLHRRQGMLSPEPPVLDGEAIVEETLAGWRSWAEMHAGYDGEYRDEVLRSALILQSLTYRPSGAVVAAVTTSLPEIPGGGSNWDYRYAWLRDSSLLARALETATCQDEAMLYLRWMTRAAMSCSASEQIGIVFGVEGERDLSERQLDGLTGFGGARPVRIGNDAWRQRQLDVFGEVLLVADLLRDELDGVDPQAAAFVCQLAGRAAEGWREADSGIWEGREGERHYLHSKLMCWAALDRAVALAPILGKGAEPERWAAARDEIRSAILEQGWHDEVGAFTGAFGSDHLDASVLMMPLVGFLAADDARVQSTIDAIERDLGEAGLLRRFSGEKGGAFLLASFWLAECHAQAGQIDRARSAFEATAAKANDLGILAEMADPITGEPIGNIPQMLSHVGLINAAAAISRAQAKSDRGSDAAVR
jgi:GH15 family glucan-1,4-alpha-glucosidase